MTELTKEQLDAAIAAGISVKLIQRATMPQQTKMSPPPPEETFNQQVPNDNHYSLKDNLTETHGNKQTHNDSKSPSPSNSTNGISKLSTTKTYGLRPRRSESKRIKYDKPDRILPTRIPKRSKDCFRDFILSNIDLKTYHGHVKDEDEVKMIELAYHTRNSQITSFIYEDTEFIAISWLSGVRIFEYFPSLREFHEVKRIPQRYIKISAKLITAIHFCDSLFYIAYLWGNEQVGCEEDSFKPFVEVRDIFGKQIGSVRYYNDTIYHLYSDTKFIYLLNNDKTVNINLRYLFQLCTYTIDVIPHCNTHPVSAWVHLSTHESYTTLQVIIATECKLLLIQYTVLEQKNLMSYTFPDNLKNFDLIRKTNKSNDYFLLRSSDESSIIELVHLTSISLILQTSLTFSSYLIIQIKIHGTDLYLLGYKRHAKTPRLEVGRISLKTLEPVSLSHIPDIVDKTCKLLVHDSSFVVIKNSQYFVTKNNLCTANKDKFRQCTECSFMVNIEDFEAHSKTQHQSVFFDMKTNHEDRILSSLKF